MATASGSSPIKTTNMESADVKTDPQIKDTLTDGLISLLGPSVEQVDERVRGVRFVNKLILNLSM